MVWWYTADHLGEDTAVDVTQLVDVQARGTGLVLSEFRK